MQFCTVQYNRRTNISASTQFNLTQLNFNFNWSWGICSSVVLYCTNCTVLRWRCTIPYWFALYYAEGCTVSYWFAWYYAEDVLYRTDLQSIMLKMYCIVLICIVLCWKVYCIVLVCIWLCWCALYCAWNWKAYCLYPEEEGHCIFFLCSLLRVPGFLLVKYECRRIGKQAWGELC